MNVSEALDIPPPREDRPPLKANIYEAARSMTSTLAPLFPYLHAGAIVPTVALFWGRRNGDYGVFHHFNTVDEVVIIFGADGAAGRARTGLVRVNAKTHGVGNFLPDPDDPDVFAVISITQRQSEAETQSEAVWFQCEKCQTELLRHEFEWHPVVTREQEEALGPLAPIETLVHSAVAATGFNETEDARTCPSCGHVNPPFPLERWGWDRYSVQTEAVRRGRAALEEAATVAGDGDGS